jgi:hypothetical protein
VARKYFLSRLFTNISQDGGREEDGLFSVSLYCLPLSKQATNYPLKAVKFVSRAEQSHELPHKQYEEEIKMECN